MKKIYTLLTFMLLSLSVQAQVSVQSLISKYKSTPKAQYVHIPKSMMTLAKMIDKGDAGDYATYAKHIDSIKVLDMEDCSKPQKEQFLKDVEKLTTAGYEEVVRANESRERAVVLIRKDKDVIRELVVVNASLEDAAVVQIQGKITEAEATRIIREQSKD